MCEGKTENRNERNIMILFLSNFNFSYYSKDILDENGEPTFDENKKKRQETRKCLLPSGRYRMEALSMSGDAEPWVECIQTNEAPIKDVLIALNGRPLDAIFCLVSDKVGGRIEGSDHVTVWKDKNSDESRTFMNEMKFFLDERLPSINNDPKVKTLLRKPLSEDLFTEVEFHESADDPSAEAIRAATALENAIANYITQENKKGTPLSIGDCHIYADITGGKRTANMAMSAALQLLQYDGANLERVIYSDFDRDRKAKENEEKPVHPVSNVQPIHDMYQLVAGVDAFKKYGSSEALDEYFSDVIADRNGYRPLKKMLFVMDKFSASVLLCQTNLIKKNLKKLMRRLHKFMKEESGNRPAKVELFARMTGELVRRYSKMLPDITKEPDEIEIIQWCTDNSLIQQALTLCTEWLPEYLTNHGAIYTDVLDVQSYCMALEEDKDAGGKKYLLMKFLGQSPSEKTMKKIYANATRRVIQGLISPHLAVCQGTEKMPQRVIVRLEKEAREVLPVKFLNKFMILLERGSTDFAKMKKKLPVNNKLLRAVVNNIIETENNNRERQANGRPFHEFTISDLTEDMIWKKLDGWCSDLQVYYKLGLPHPQCSYSYGVLESVSADASSGKIQEGSIPWRGKISRETVKISRKMLAGHMLQSDLPMDEALKYIRGYTYIRADLRNKINHASKETVKIDLQKVRRDIDEYLILLRKLRGRKHVHTGLWSESLKEEASK